MENKPSTTQLDQDAKDEYSFTSEKEAVNTSDAPSKDESPQLEQSSWDMSPEAAHRTVELLQGELAAEGGEIDAAKVEYEEEQQKIHDKIAKNEEEIAAQKTIADRIVKELSNSEALDVAYVNLKITELDSSFNTMIGLENTNNTLQKEMEVSLQKYEQLLYKRYDTLNNLRNNYGNYFIAFLQTYDERGPESAHPRVKEVMQRHDAMRMSVDHEIRTTIPEALQSLNNLRDQHIHIKENILRGAQATVRLVSKGAELRQNDSSSLEEADRRELVASLENIDRAIMTPLYGTNAQVISLPVSPHGEEEGIAA